MTDLGWIIVCVAAVLLACAGYVGWFEWKIRRRVQCSECKGSGVVEWIDHMGRPCDACNGIGDYNPHQRMMEWDL